MKRLKNLKLNIISVIFTLLQAIILTPPLVLEYLSTRKMGVIRYLVYLEREYGEVYLCNNSFIFYKVGIIILFIIAIIMLISYYKKNKNKRLFVELTLNVVINLIAVIFIFNGGFKGLNAYIVFLLAAFVIVILQYIKIILSIMTTGFKR